MATIPNDAQDNELVIRDVAASYTVAVAPQQACAAA
jgi:hypothetical protein